MSTPEHLLMLPSRKARLKLPPPLVDDDPAMIEAAPPDSPEESPAETLNVPPLPSPEPTEIAMLPPDPLADDPLPRLTWPLVPTVAAPVLRDKSPDTPEVPALLVDTDTLPELVSAPTPDEIAMDPPEAKVGAPRYNWDVGHINWDVARRRGYGRGNLQRCGHPRHRDPETDKVS